MFWLRVFCIKICFWKWRTVTLTPFYKLIEISIRLLILSPWVFSILFPWFHLVGLFLPWQVGRTRPTSPASASTTPWYIYHIYIHPDIFIIFIYNLIYLSCINIHPDIFIIFKYTPIYIHPDIFIYTQIYLSYIYIHPDIFTIYLYTPWYIYHIFIYTLKYLSYIYIHPAFTIYLYTPWYIYHIYIHPIYIVYLCSLLE